MLQNFQPKKVVNAGYFLDIINVLLCLVVAILTHDIFKKLHSAIKYIWLFGSKRVGFSDCRDGRWGGWVSKATTLPRTVPCTA